MAINSKYISVSSVSKSTNSSWIYLVDWILALILILSFIFYFSRLVGFLVSQALKWIVWRSSGIRITIESLRISPLGGRLFAKNVTLITKDYTISILKATFTWKYWLFKLTRLSRFYYDDIESEDNPKGADEALAFRFSLVLEGFEIFIYNRSVAYDSILKIIEEEQNSCSFNKNYSSEKASSDNSCSIRFRNAKPEQNSYMDSTTSDKHSENENELSNTQSDTSSTKAYLPFLLKILPLSIIIRKGAVVMGNSTTPSILVASYKSATAIVDIGKAPNILDYHRVTSKFELGGFQVSMKPNISFDKTLSNQSSNRDGVIDQRRRNYQKWRKFRVIFDKIVNPIRRKSSFNDTLDPSYDDWIGMKRYIGDQKGHNKIDASISDIEYAKYSLILDSSITSFTYFFDSPGFEQSSSLHNHSRPEMGIEVQLSKSTIHYGPWADKQRVPLQSMFFPLLSRDSKPTEVLRIPGSLREYNGFKITLSVQDELVIRIPTREPSKDNLFIASKSTNHLTNNKVTRPFGWLELKVGMGSEMTYFNSFIATERGWANTFHAILKKPELRTSVNHDVLLSADNHVMNCEIGFPLKWNGKCDWKFNNISDNASLFFLRDHTMLFADILEDFSSGSPTPYEYVRPFDYLVNWKVNNYKIYLNVNDSNIINNPLDFSNNKYITFQGDLLETQIFIPLNSQLSRSTKIEYNVDTPFFDLVLLTPPWDTTNAFLKDSLEMGKAHNFNIKGSYQFFHSVEINTFNHVVVECIGDFITLKFYGYLIKYLFAVRENYFGDHMHFQTFEEYSASLDASSKNEVKDNGTLDSTSLEDYTLRQEEKSFDYWKVIKTENDVDLLFIFQVRHGLIILPNNIYDSSSHISLGFDSLDIDIRFNNYYMDLEADFTPITVLYFKNTDLKVDLNIMFNIPKYNKLFTEKNDKTMFIDGIKIHSHRMFGIPPQEIVYFAKWDISCGMININGDGSFISALNRSLLSFTLGYLNIENSLNIQELHVYDISNFSFRCPYISAKLKLAIDDENSPILNLDLESILLNVNDITNDRYSTKISILISSILVEIIASDTSCDKILGHFETSINLNNFCQKPHMSEHRIIQQERVQLNDAPFHRLPFLLYEKNRDDKYMDAYGCFLTNLTLPDVNFPINEESFEKFFGEFALDDVSLNFDDKGMYSSPLRDSDNFKAFPPTLNYDTNDFCPSYSLDSNYEYDNFVLELESINSFLTPKSLLPVAKFVESLLSCSLDSVMDSLQFDIIRELKQTLWPIYLISNFRIVSQEVHFKFGEFDVSDSQEVFLKPPLASTFNLDFVEPSVVLSKNKKNCQNLNNKIQPDMSAAFHLKDLFFSISNPSTFSSPIHGNVMDAEFWFTYEDLGNSIGSLNIGSIDINLKHSEIGWLYNYYESILNDATPALDIFQALSDLESHSLSALVYKVALAGSQYHIDQDPGVLTKPASILRAQNDHIRYYDSWKLTTKLRHILDSLPESWHIEQDKLFNSFDWEVSDSAYDEVSEIFSRWRNWESNEVQRSNFFKKIFLNNKNSNIQDLSIQVQVTQFCLNLVNDKKSSDSINLEDLYLSFSMFKEHQKDMTAMNLGILEYLKRIDTVLNISKYYSKVSTLSFDSLASLIGKKFTMKLDDATQITTDNVLTYLDITAIANINKLHQIICLPMSTIEININNLVNAIDLFHITSAAELPLNYTLKLENFDISISMKEFKCFYYSFDDFQVLFANKGPIEEGNKVVDIIMNKSILGIYSQHEDFYDLLFSTIKRDFEYLESLTNFQNAYKGRALHSNESKKKIARNSNPSNILVTLTANEISWNLEILKPLIISGSIQSGHLSLDLNEKASIFGSFIQKFDIGVLIEGVSIIQLENSSISSNIRFTQIEKLIAISANLKLGYSKLFTPHVIDAFEVIIQNRKMLEHSLRKLQNIPSMLNSAKENTENAINENILKRIALKFEFLNDYIGISTYVGKTKFSFEIEGTSSRVFNVSPSLDNDGSELHEIVPLYGDFSIPTARLSVVDRGIPVGLSNILDVNISAKVLNDHNEKKSQSLQVESQYFRVCLNPQIIFKVINSIDSFEGLMERANFEEFQKASNPRKSIDTSFLNFSTIHVLSYNFCIGWLFSDAPKAYPGIIFGAERFFAVTGNGIGKFTLMESYLSVANGSRSSNYYNILSERNNPNRAFLPTMQWTYTVEQIIDSKNMRIAVNGDKLDVKFLSDSIAIVEFAVNSGSEIQDFLSKRAMNLSLPREDKVPHNDYVNSIHTLFSKIEISFNFAGSNVLLYRLTEDENMSNSPSLSLHSPAVKIVAMYTHNKSGKKKHSFNSEILTSSSDNTLFSSCVPVILDIVESSKRILQKSNSNSFHNAHLGSVKDFKLGSILKDIDFHLGVKIEKQKLSLSCEPTAKVEAIVGIDGIYFQLNSSDGEVPSLITTIQTESVSAFLQHIYSREISGSIGFRSFVLTSSAKFVDILHILLSSYISDMEGYINVKQYQDLELFKDIWFPITNNLPNEPTSIVSYQKRIDNSELAHNKNISSRCKEVATTFAIPWVLTFMIFNVHLKVDFGQSIGNFSLCINRFWAISKQSSDWTQDLQMGINIISLASTGRLAGSLEVHDIHLHTAISWKLESREILDVPLILATICVEKCQLKASFDFHVFAVSNIEGFSINVYNRKGELSLSRDHLYVFTKFDCAEVYITALAASTILDIYNTISRMIQENRTSYKETLRDSSRDKNSSNKKLSEKVANSTILETIKRLETKIEVVVGRMLVQVYPSSFEDNKALVIKLDESKANFQQNEYSNGIANELELQFNDLSVLLSVTSAMSENFVQKCAVHEFVEFAHKAGGGTIFIFPSFKIYMSTFQKNGSNSVEFLYQSSFGGTVDIRWNLGSINFIREMYAVHLKALESRIEYKKAPEIESREDEFSDTSFKSHGLLTDPLMKQDATEVLDHAIESTINKVSEESKYTYVPLAPPIIEAPRLKELGNATPPLEWFGLHRDKFPNATHQIVIVSLQKLNREIEYQYSKMLGKA